MKKPFLFKILFVLLILISLSGYISSPVALLMGFVFTLLFNQHCLQFTQVAIQYALKISIIGLGFSMFLTETIQTGKDGLTLTILTIIATLLLGWGLTRVLKIDLKLGYLISSGTSICGGSAIAAVAPVIRAKPEMISIALGVVFLLNSIALIIFPWLGHLFELSQYQFGMWAAVAIHDTSSVVGAALTYGEEALRIATTVKLARALWIIPISLISMLLFKSKSGKIKIPWFIVLFLIAILINSYYELPQMLTFAIATASKRLLIATLFLVGTTLSIKDLRETGVKPLLLGIGLWIAISAFSLVYILV